MKQLINTHKLYWLLHFSEVQITHWSPTSFRVISFWSLLTEVKIKEIRKFYVFWQPVNMI